MNALPLLLAWSAIGGALSPPDTALPLELDTVHLQSRPTREGVVACRAVDYITGNFIGLGAPKRASLRHAYVWLTRYEVTVTPHTFQHGLYKRSWPFCNRPKLNAKYRRMVEEQANHRFRFKLLEESHTATHDIVLSYCLDPGTYEVSLMDGVEGSDGKCQIIAKGMLVVVND